jgi:hypothetical protein
MTHINTHDHTILRSLAGQLRDHCERPEMKRRPDRWCRHNALQDSEPKVLCFPEGAWVEILPPEALKCEGSLSREWETALRKRLFTVEMLKDDQPQDPWFDINWRMDRGTYGVEVPETHGDHRGSYKYDPPLKDLDEDFEKLRFRQPSVDRARTEQELSQAQEIFGDLLPARIRGAAWWTMGLTWEAIKLVGLEELMFLPYDDPDGLHRLMAWLRDEHLNYINWFETHGYLTDQNESDYVGSGGIGYTHELPLQEREPGAPVRLMDRWGFAESQETVGISPAMFHEFFFPYQVPLLEKFGLNYYGCCEPLEQRMEDILKIPRLRRVSVSPWADVGKMADILGNRYLYCRKPNPAPVCINFQEDVIRQELRKTLDKSKGCHIELILKDTHTIEHKPHRLARWVEIAREEIARSS